MIDWLKKNKEKLSGIALLLGLVYFGGVIFRTEIYVPSQLRQHGRYTVATTGEMFFLARGGRKVEYFYRVNGVDYEDYWGFITSAGEKYLIRYSEKNPKINERVYDYPVPTEFRVPPDTGWAKLPY